MLLVASCLYVFARVCCESLCCVCDFILGTCETQGIKRGRLKMYSQDGAVVVHEARHELRHQMRIQEAGRVS